LKTVNVHIYPSAFRFESRILKETKSIIKLNLASEVLILSAGEKDQLKHEFVSDGIWVHRIKSLFWWLPESRIRKIIFYLEFYVRAIFYGLTIRIDIINCHSLMVLPMSVILKRLKGAQLIYDPHELETERVGLAGVAQRVSKWVERNLIYSADAVIVVGDSISRWYASTYDLDNVYTVKNIPYNIQIDHSNLFRERFGIPESHQIFLYQGLVSDGRSINIYLKAFSKARPDQHLVIMGYGSQVTLVKQYAIDLANIHFHEAVEPSALLKYTCSADVGLSLIEDVCLSYYYCMPNKFFEYVIAEIPLIVSNFPDMAALVNQHDLGWAIAVSEDALNDTLRKLTTEELAIKKQSLKKAKHLFSWSSQEQIIAQVYRRLSEAKISQTKVFINRS
jgi:glycosyltransferase involved in cell wall biosynthesis